MSVIRGCSSDKNTKMCARVKVVSPLNGIKMDVAVAKHVDTVSKYMIKNFRMACLIKCRLESVQQDVVYKYLKLMMHGQTLHHLKITTNRMC